MIEKCYRRQTDEHVVAGGKSQWVRLLLGLLNFSYPLFSFQHVGVHTCVMCFHGVTNSFIVRSHRSDRGLFTSTCNQVSGSKVIHTVFKLLQPVRSIFFLIFFLWLLFDDYKQNRSDVNSLIYRSGSGSVGASASGSSGLLSGSAVCRTSLYTLWDDSCLVFDWQQVDDFFLLHSRHFPGNLLVTPNYFWAPLLAAVHRSTGTPHHTKQTHSSHCVFIYDLRSNLSKLFHEELTTVMMNFLLCSITF